MNHLKPYAGTTLSSLSRIMCLILLLVGSRMGTAQTPSTPDTPAGETLNAFLEAFNSGDHAKLEAYIKTYAPNDTVDDLASFSSQTGGFTLLSIAESKPGFISFRVKGRADHLEAYGTFTLASTNPAKVKDWTITVIPPGATIDILTLDATSRQHTIDLISAKLTSYYIYLDIAQKMNQAIADHAKHGDYDQITDGSTFAAALMKDLRAVSNDKHLFVTYQPFTFPPHPDDDKSHAPTPPDRERIRSRLERDNCLFSKVEILSNNIGYLKFDAFMNPEICGPTVASAMGFLAHTDAVIIDLRSNGGGDPAMVQLIASYFFSESTHLNDLYNRHDDVTTQYWTLPYIPGQRISAPLFVLTSSRTFSGAEEFTYDMQTQKRATIVGETTGGGAHPVDGMQIGDHFILGVPLARPINPITKTDWEGIGITPDVKVPASEALTTAQKFAISKLQPKPNEKSSF